MSRDHTGSFLAIEAKHDSEVISTMTIHDNFSSINIILDDTNDRVWSKI